MIRKVGQTELVYALLTRSAFVSGLCVQQDYKSLCAAVMSCVLRNVTATLTAYIFGMKHNIHNRESALEGMGLPIHCLKML